MNITNLDTVSAYFVRVPSENLESKMAESVDPSTNNISVQFTFDSVCGGAE